MYTLFVVAPVRIYREGITALFTTCGQFVVCGTDISIGSAFRTDADAVIVDYSTIRPGILDKYPGAASTPSPTIAIGVPDNTHIALAVIEAGAAAYVSENATALELYETVLAVVEGRAHLSPEIAALLLDRARAHARARSPNTFRRLTPREFQVAELMGRHRSNKDIAVALGISVHTVKIHVHHVIQKLALERRSQARDALMIGSSG
jgi:two-component system, NarL family, nitrate/nitrite response regulator NarL